MQMTRSMQGFSVFPLLAALAACSGGGGGGSSPPPAATNRAPVITSPLSASIAENASGVVYTLTASDPDGDTVTISVVAGGDEDMFSINGGDVSIATPLDFENPADADGNNIYEITFRVQDPGGLRTEQTVSLTVTDAVESMALRRVGEGFNSPLYLEGIPGSSSVVVVEKGGLVRVLDPDSGAIQSVPFLDVSGEVSTDGERGLLGLAFSPEFATDRTVYVNLTNSTGTTEIRRYQTFAGTPAQVDPSTEDIILTVAQISNNHNAGWIGFDDTGLLYVPLGDGGGGGDPNEVAQDTSELLGKILRLDVSSDAFPGDDLRDYAIPAGNAFPGGAGGREEIYAIGLRNPFRGSFDPDTGDFFIGDVGQSSREEVNRMTTDEGGVNFGWDDQEGTIDFEASDRPELVDPVAEYVWGTGPFEGRSITGGYVYRGNIQPIQNHYVFGDFITGNIWSIPVDDLVRGSTVPSTRFNRLNDSLIPDAGSIGNVSSFGLDAPGNLYIVSYGGDIFRVETAP